MPLDAYRVAGTNSAVIGYAIATMRQRCMKRFGFDLKIRSYDAATEFANNRLEDSRRYGITDPVTARIYGYGFPPSSLPGPDHSADGASAAFLFVLEGTKDGTVILRRPGMKLVSPGNAGGLPIPPGGCALEGAKMVEGDYSTLSDLGNGLARLAGQSAVADPAFAELNTKWAECMAASGYTRTSPAGDIVPRTDGKPAPAAEVQEALTDIACKHTTDYVNRFAQLHIKYEQQQLEANQLALAEDQARITEVVKRAAAILGTG